MKDLIVFLIARQVTLVLPNVKQDEFISRDSSESITPTVPALKIFFNYK